MKKLMFLLVLASLGGLMSTAPGLLLFESDCDYCCPKCNRCGAKDSKCDKDKCEMVKQGTYCCKDDLEKSKKPGKCKKCGKDMKKMDCMKNMKEDKAEDSKNNNK
jgi:hypothetical protein